jgi:hypothetical protein
MIYALAGKQFKIFKYLLFSGFLAVVIGLPQLLSLFKSFTEITSGTSQAARVGAVLSHAPIFEKLVLAALIFYILFLFFLRRRGENRKELLFPAFLLIAGTIAVNQQVITGKLIQPFHYYFYTNLPAAYIALAVIFGYAVNFIRQKYLKYPAVAVVFILLFAWGAGIQASSYNFWAPKYRELQNYGVITDWFKNNAAKDSVIYGNDEISNLIPAYTPFFVYWSVFASQSPSTPAERNESAYFINMRLRGIGADEAKKYLENNREDFGLRTDAQYYRDLCGSYGCFPDEVLNRVVEDYQSFMRRPFLEEVKKYKLDYFVWDKNKNPDWRVAELGLVSPIYEYREIEIFKVN